MIRFPFITLLLFSFPFLSLAQNNPILAAGNITNLSVAQQKISFATQNAFGEIIVYSPNIIRVRLDKKKLGKDFSYAVVTSPKTTKTTITQRENEIEILTDSLKVIVGKSPFNVGFIPVMVR
jgi:alpha-glucosidase